MGNFFIIIALIAILLLTPVSYMRIDAKCTLPIVVNKFGFSSCEFPPDISVLDEEKHIAATDQLKLITGSNYTIDIHVGNSGRKDGIPFYLILQIKDENGVIHELMWRKETIRPILQSQHFKLPWVPRQAGNFTIEAYMWSNLDMPEVLTTPRPIGISVVDLDTLKNTNMEINVYGSYDPASLSGHFLKGKLSDGSGRPVANGNVTIFVDHQLMGITLSDPEGCFDFNDWKDYKLLQEIQNARERGQSNVDLGFTAVYSGNVEHRPANATKISILYLFAVPLRPAQYEISTSPSIIQVKPGESTDFESKVKPLYKEVEVEHMSLFIERLPCGVSYGFRDQPYDDSRVTLEHPGIFKIVLMTEEYTKPGRYHLQLLQDATHNPYIRDPDLGMIVFEVMPP